MKITRPIGPLRIAARTGADAVSHAIATSKPDNRWTVTDQRVRKLSVGSYEVRLTLVLPD